MRLSKLLHNQSGRSLVEILAVLAIMGVLSLAGIYGIQYAMEMSRENETLNRFSKVVAGARTSRILENLGDKTKYNQNTGDERKEGYAKMPVDMHDVISNIGEDIYVAPATDVDGKESVTSHISAPLQGPSDTQGSLDNVKIYVYVETPEAFTVHADNLTFDACMKIVQSNLGYTFTYETSDDNSSWRVPAQVQTPEGARALCEKVVLGADIKTAMVYSPFVRRAVAASPSHGRPGTLVMWFGPYMCMGADCAANLCEGAECCCEFTDGGRKVQLKDPSPVGCKPATGKCIDCATPDSKGICAPKAGFSSCEPKCTINVCQNAQNPYYCGDGLCCPSAETCGKGTCTGVAVKCKDPARPNVCGTQCCAATEDCVNGTCEPRGVCAGTKQTCYKQTDGGFSHCCNQDQTCCGNKCCSASEQCNEFDQCESIKCNETSVNYCAPGLCCNDKSKCEDGVCVPACEGGEKQYCAEEKDFFVLTSAGQCWVNGSECNKYACTSASLILKDPNAPKKRSIEVPMPGIKGYSYCAYEINNKCALVTYCDTPPVKVAGRSYLEQCNSCTPVDTSVPDSFWNQSAQVCIGSKIVSISTLQDKKNAIFMGQCKPGRYPDCEPGCFDPPEPGECGPCPEGMEVIANGSCCDPKTQTAWISCSHCSPPPTFTDNCGRTHAVKDICCPKSSAGGGGCTGPGREGRCIDNFPVNGSCCPKACLKENGDGELACCAEDTPTANGVCCDKDPSETEECCKAHDNEWCKTDPNNDDSGECCGEGESCVEDSKNPGQKTCKDDSETECEKKGMVGGYENKGGDKDGCCAKDRACPEQCCPAGPCSK